MNYGINYEDDKFKAVEEDKQVALDKINDTYDNMIGSSDEYYQNQIDAVKDYQGEQQKLQQENTDLTIEQINQQKEQAGKDYTKEQAGSYVDWQKQSNQYGTNAEQQATQGLTNTGYSESSQVSMYNQYQNRVATARDSFNRAVLNYDNSIKEAQLANNSKLAEIAYNALQTQLQLSLEGFQYKNNLLQTQIQQQQATEDRYYSRWQDVLNQMNTENSMKEQIRQYEQNYTLQTKQFNEGIRQFNEEIARLKAQDKIENEYKIKQLELQKQQLAEQKRQADLDYQYKQASLAEQIRSNKASESISYSSSSGGSGGGSATLTDNSSGTKYGYFSNGYQPKGVVVNGKDYELKSSGLKVYNVFNEGSSSKNATTFGKQNIWQAGGRYYVWDGSIRDYVDVTSKVKTSQSKKVNFDWGR